MNLKRRVPVFLAVSVLALLIAYAGSALPQPGDAAAEPLNVSEPTGRLVSYRTAVAPALDGAVEAIWLQAPVLAITTTHGTDVLLRSLHTPTEVYFLAQWSGPPPPAQDNAVFNTLTVHWTIPPSAKGLPPPSCDAACHTTYADGRGRVVSAGTETIPPGRVEMLPAAGGWDDGTWTVEWHRPLLSANPYDVQLTDLSQSYTFFVKMFERVDGRADPVSASHVLVFEP